VQGPALEVAEPRCHSRTTVQLYLPASTDVLFDGWRKERTLQVRFLVVNIVILFRFYFIFHITNRLGISRYNILPQENSSKGQHHAKRRKEEET
jgi:hypothetical protein